jgi:hypothetical protein
MHEDVAITKDPYSELKDSLGSVPEILGGSDPEWRDKVGAAPASEPSTKTTDPPKTTVDDIKGDKSIADLIKSLIDKKAIITGANTGIIQTDGSVDWKGDIKITAAGNLELTGTKGVKVTSSSGDVTISGKNATLKGSAKVEVNGSAGADIKSSSAINIKGSMVNVN